MKPQVQPQIEVTVMKPTPRSSFAWTPVLAVLLAALSAKAFPAVDPDFHVAAATRPAALNVPAQNVLTWPEARLADQTPVTQFSLYRKIDPAAPYPRMPIAASLQVISDCTKLKALITVGSPDWKLMEQAIGGGRIGLGDPCKMGSLSRTSDAWKRLELLARNRWKVAVALGQGFQDLSVVTGKTYYYQVRGNVSGQQVVLATDIAVKAGFPASVSPPAGLTALSGDSRVLLHWGDQPEASGFDLYRATSQAGPYFLVNEAGTTAKLLDDLQGNPLFPDHHAVNGLIDFQRWDPSGNPQAHQVGNLLIDGPTNDVIYFYKVASLDLLGSAGIPSAAVSAAPKDTTAPAIPGEVTVIPDDAAGRMQVRWAAVSRDVEGHPEVGIKGYRLYRRSDPNLPESAGVQIGALIPQPPVGSTLVYADDPDPALRPPFGEQTFWYQVECEDLAGNKSARSTAISGHLKDITPPAAPQGVAAQGFETSILVTWTLNSEPDMDGYQIYRGLCDKGTWACAVPNITGLPCESGFALLGYLSQKDAQQKGAQWNDTTVPAGSPLCYAYLVKAVDQAQNRNGALPPDLATETVICQRLRDTTPPEAAVIVGLAARDHSVQVEWVGAPVQDIHAFHVYRSAEKDGPYAFVGGMTVEEPPAQPVVLTQPYQAPLAVGCDKVPLHIHDGMSIGSFLDTSATPKKVYWYVVRGIDWDGNEAVGGVPVSTFTYTTQVPQSPSIVTISQSTAPIGLRVQWGPAYDPAKHRGFAVFRSETANGAYRQVGSLLSASEFVDSEVVKGVSYWYRIARLDLDGGVSYLSGLQSGKVN
jgi:hypothetical protein